VATITTRILSRALQQGILKWGVKPEELAAAATLQLAIDGAVFGIDRGIVTGREIVRPRRAISESPFEIQ
jgi:hypothetical protein